MRCLRGLRQDSRRRMALCSSVRKDASAVTVDGNPGSGSRAWGSGGCARCVEQRQQPGSFGGEVVASPYLPPIV